MGLFSVIKNTKKLNIPMSSSTSISSAVNPSSVKKALSTEDPAAFIKRTVAENDIVIFSKSYCPFCRKTKEKFEQILKSRGDADQLSLVVIELDLVGDEGRRIQESLLEITGQRTVPNVFVAGKHVGGNDMVQKWAGKGKIDEMLNNKMKGGERRSRF
jgi:glutaredoxin 3